MQKQTIQTFNDGIASFYAVNDDDTITAFAEGIRFGTKTVGSTRFFSAMEQQHRADKSVRVPRFASEIDANTVAIIGEKQYTLLQVQEILDTMPPCYQITLEELKGVNYHDIRRNAE